MSADVAKVSLERLVRRFSSRLANKSSFEKRKKGIIKNNIYCDFFSRSISIKKLINLCFYWLCFAIIYR